MEETSEKRRKPRSEKVGEIGEGDGDEIIGGEKGEIVKGDGCKIRGERWDHWRGRRQDRRRDQEGKRSPEEKRDRENIFLKL